MNTSRPKGSFFKSLRFRILSILLLLGTVPGLIALHVMLNSYMKEAVDRRISNVCEQCTLVSKSVIRSGFPQEGLKNSRKNVELLANLLEGRVLVCDESYRIILDTFRVDEGKYLISPLVTACARGERATEYDRSLSRIQVAVPLNSPDLVDTAGVMLVSASSLEVTEIIHDLQQKEVILMIIVVIIVMFLSYIFSDILVRPFARVTKAIEDLTDGYHDGDISVPDITETALITDAFNRMLGRMKVVDESRNEFVSNVSHELKTPMTSMKVLADSLLGQSGVPEELYQEFLGDIAVEIDRENKIISDLLALVRLDKRAGNLIVSHVNINNLLEDVLKRLKPLADQRHIDLFLDDCNRRVEADVDEAKFTSIVTNLVENGIKYNVDEGWVRVTINSDHQSLYLTVADSGMGIPADAQDKIFERFYRVDKSHSTEIGGTGLGLAIARSAIGAHHGSVHVQSTEGEGTTFVVKIPLKYVPEKGEMNETW